MYRSYIKMLLVSALILLTMSALVNIIVDPYGLYRWVDFPGFNARKPKSGPNGQLVKPHNVIKIRPKSLILGNSRVEAGIDPQSAQLALAPVPVYNMALPASGIGASLHSLKHVMAVAKPNLVILGLDFFDFVFDAERSVGSPPAPAPSQESDFEKRLLVTAGGSPNKPHIWQHAVDHLTASFSLSTVADSLQTVALQNIADQSDLTPLGFNPMNEFRRFIGTDGQDVMFRQVIKTYLASYLRIKAQIYAPGSTTSRELALFRQLISLCRESSVRLIIYIHPYHAHMMESYRIAGFWPLFDEWKRALIRILVAEAAEHPGREPFPLWDFSGYNEVTTERVPGADEKGRMMKWYWEAGHYNREVGELILARMFQLDHGIPEPDQGFGIRLSELNIEQHLDNIRSAQKLYARLHSDEVTALQDIAETLKNPRKRDRAGP